MVQAPSDGRKCRLAYKVLKWFCRRFARRVFVLRAADELTGGRKAKTYFAAVAAGGFFFVTVTFAADEAEISQRPIAIASGNASGIGGVGRDAVLQVLRQRSEKADDVAEALLLIRLGHADNRAARMGVGVVAGVGGTGGEYDGDAAPLDARFHVGAQIVAGGACAFDFGDDEGGSKDVEDFAGIGGVMDGNHIVAFVLEISFETVAQ